MNSVSLTDSSADCVAPSKTTIKHNGAEIHLIESWRNLIILPLMVSSLFMLNFTINGFSIARQNDNAGEYFFSFIALCITLIFIWLLMAFIINKTVVRISPNGFDVTTGPIKYPGRNGLSRVVPGEVIGVGIEIQASVSSPKNSPSELTRHYQVVLKLHARGEEPILRPFLNPAHARYIQRAIMDHLGLKQ